MSQIERQLVPLDFANFSALNFVLQSLFEDPIVAVEGKVYYNNVNKVPKFYNGTEWAPFGGKPIQKEYTNQTALFSNQAEQLKDFIYYQQAGQTYYHYLGTTNGNITDYRPLGGIGHFVPYNGALNNVNLGEYGISVGYLTFDTTPTNIPATQGTMFWDEDDLTVDIILNGFRMKIGEDIFYPVKNQTGTLIPKGTNVRFAGTLGSSGRLLIVPFLANGSFPSNYYMGVTAENIANGADGKVLWFGRIRGINTNAFNANDILYASTTVAGGFQTTVPTAPNNIIEIAAVINKSTTQGVIFVRPLLGSNINRDEGVRIVSPTNNDVLLYKTATGLWENATLSSISYTHPTYTVRNIDTSGAQVIDIFTSDAIGSVTNITTRTMTLADLGYTGATNADNYGSWLLAASGTAGTASITSGTTVTLNAGTGMTVTRATNTVTFATTITQYTDALARAAISLTTTGTSGVATYNSSTGVFNIPNYTYTLPLATSTVTGGVRLFSDTSQTVAANAVSSTASRTYGVQLNASSQMVVNVPWTDTVYTHPTYTAVSQTLSGATVLATFSTDTIGSVTGFTTRTLTAANIGAEPAFSKGSLIQGGAITLTGTLTSRLVGTGDITIGHSDTSTQASVSNTNGTIIQSATLDTYGHVTALSSLDGDVRWVRNIDVLNNQSVWSHVALQSGIDIQGYTTGSSGFPSTLGLAVAFYTSTSDSTSGFGRTFALNREYNTENYYLGSPNTSGVHNGWRLIYHAGNLTLSTLGGVPTTRTITINGIALDLSANRSWSVGTVTSVSGTGSYGGLTLTGTVTGSGSITLGGTPSGTWPIASQAVISGTITDLNAAWTLPGTSISNAMYLYRYDSSATNKPVTFDNANWLMNIYSHPTGGTASYGHQLAGADNDTMYFRNVLNGSFGTWRTVFHSGNGSLQAITNVGNTTSNSIVFNRSLSNGNLLLDLQQSYSIYSDNAGTGGNNTRLWFETPNQGEVVIGPRSGANLLGNFRIRSSVISIESTTSGSSVLINSLGNLLINTTTDNGAKFQVNGGATLVGNLILNSTANRTVGLGTTSADTYLTFNSDDSAILNVASGKNLNIQRAAASFIDFDGAGIRTHVGGIRTTAPVGTTADHWKLGRAVLATSVINEDRWIRVQIGADYYDILAIYRGTEPV